MIRSLPLWLCVFLFMASGASAASLIRPEDRIVFVGDSITGQGGNGGDRGWIGLMRSALAADNPANRQTMVALGGSGQTVGGWINVERKSRTTSSFLDVKTFDVQAELGRPADVVVIMLGMNDVLAPRLADNDEGYKKWIEEYRTLIGALRERTTPRVIALATPTPCTEDPASPKNRVMDTMSARLAKLAEEEKCVLLPTRETSWAMLTMGRRLRPDFHVTSDQVHANSFGHLAIAAGMLRGLGETKAAEALMKRGKAEANKNAGATALSHEAALLPAERPGAPLRFQVRAYHDLNTVQLETPAGWRIEDTKKGKGETLFTVSSGATDFELVNRLVLKAGGESQEVSLPAPWLLGTGNVRWKGWASGVFNPEIGWLPMDAIVRTGDGFEKAMSAMELAPGSPVAWTRFVGGVNYGGGGAPGAIDFAAVTYFAGGEVGYGLRWIHSDRERPVTVTTSRLGFAGTTHLELWLNGETVYIGDIGKAKGREFPVTLKAGWNRLSFKSNFQQWQWQLTVDMKPEAGDTLEGLRYSIQPR